MTIIKEHDLDKALGSFNELMELDQNRISIICLIDEQKSNNEKKEKIEPQKQELNEHWFAIYNKVQYSYWPEHRYIKWHIHKEMQPKDVYKLVNPNNESCQFDISAWAKTYSFFNNTVNDNKYRYYTIVEVNNYDF